MKKIFKDDKNFEDLMGKDNYDKLWKQADEIIETTRSIEEIYDNVPDNLKGVTIKVMEIHIFPEKYKKKINYFLNEEEYPNSLDYIED
jgi:hypothetical protein